MVMVTIITPVTRTGPNASASRDAANEIIDLLSPFLAHHKRAWAARCQEHGLSIIGFQVLALLEMHEGMSMSRLAEELGVALPNATGIVTRMAERGFVDRTHDEADRRIVRIGLTDAGRQLIGEMEAGRRARMAHLIEILDERQQQRLLQTVRDLHGAAIHLREQEEQQTEQSPA